MDLIIYLLIGLIVGGLMGYFIFKISLQKNFTSNSEFNSLQNALSDLKIENAKRISREELMQNYISKELYESVNSALASAKDDSANEKKETIKNQAAILKLTGESEQKLSKAEVESNYVAKDSFDIINRKLNSAESELIKRNEVIVGLNNQLTELQQKEEYLNEKLTTFKTELESLHILSKEQFKNLATDIMKEKKDEFVIENKKELAFVIDPFKNDLKDFKEKVEATRKEDIGDLTSLKKELELLQKLNVQLSDDAKNLTSALKSEVKMQGNWGEDR